VGLQTGRTDTAGLDDATAATGEPWRRGVRALFWLYTVALIVGTHWPRLTVPDPGLVFGVDKWLHVGAFGGFTLLLLIAELAPGRRPTAKLAWALAIAAAFTIVDEITQNLFSERTFSLGDILAGLLGVVAVGLVWPARSRLRGLVASDGSFFAHARIMALLTLLSRVFGLVRDWALAFLFGFGWVFDAWVVAFMIPNLFRRLFGEGALAGAFVPHYTKLVETGEPTRARDFAFLVLRALWWGLGAIVLIGSAVLAGLFLFVDLDARGTLTAGLTLLTLWYMPLVCIAAILGAMLQVRGRFGVPSFSPVILNLCLIGAAIGAAMLPGLPLDRKAYLLAGALVLAGLIQVLWHRLALQAIGVKVGAGRSTAQVWWGEPDARGSFQAMARQWLPTVLGLAVFQVNTLADALIAMFFSGAVGETISLFGRNVAYPMEPGAVAILGAAARLYEFPLGVFGIAVATAIFPALSRTADDRDAFGELVRQGLRLTLFIGLPASVGLILVREPLAQAIYAAAGRIDAGDSTRVAAVLLGYAPAVWAYSLNHLLVRAFYAQHNPTTPMRVSLAMVALNVALNLTLIWPLGAAGLAASTAICAVLQCVILVALVRRYAERPVDGEVLRSAGRTLLLTGVMAAAVFGLLAPFGAATMPRLPVIGLLAGAVALGGLVIAGGARLLRMPELHWTLGRSTRA